MQKSRMYDVQEEEEEEDYSEESCALSEQPAVAKANTGKLIGSETENWDLDLE